MQEEVSEMAIESRTVTDGVITAGLVTSPAWASWLGDLNQVLTTLTLVVGLVLGVARLIVFLRERRR